jgi:Fe-S cluster biogenesis protein NfuA/nitrite reductase/ring-hydroxylating ferredoxin subunit
MSNNNASLFAADDFAREGQKIQEFVEKIGELPDPTARRMLQECLESVLGFYGRGLERIMELLGESDAKAHDALLNDPGVRGLLLIHGLHPVPLETRLHEALAKVRPYMESHGGNVELLSLENDFAKLRLVGHCRTCPSSTVTLELAVRAAIEEACPDLQGFEVEGAAKHAGFEHVPKSAPEWMTIEGTDDLSEGKFMSVPTESEPVLVCKVSGTLYAYGDRCPACNLPLHLGEIRNNQLVCSLGHRYDVRHAGAGLDGAGLHLEPLPLMTQDGTVRVARARAASNHPEAVPA